MESVGRLVASVGRSPLPVARWLAVLQPIRLVLMSSSDTRAVAERIGHHYLSRRPDAEISHFNVPPDIPFDIERAIREALGSKPASILYGGGTTPMNVLLNQWWLANCLGEHAYYASVKDGRLHRDDGQSYAPAAQRAGFTIESIMNLHLEPGEHHLEFGEADVEALVAQPTDAERTFVGRAVELMLSDRDTKQTMDDLVRLVSQLGHTLSKPRRVHFQHLCALQDPGLLFEVSAAAFLCAIARSAGTPAEEVRMNVKVLSAEREPQMELDVVERRDEMLTVVSCGVMPSLSDTRKKHFEVKDRAGSIGGSEARSLSVVHPRDLAWLDDKRLRTRASELRKRLKSTARLDPRERNALVLARELFGSDPVRRIKDPDTMIGSPDEHVYRWIVGTRPRGAPQ